MNDSEANQETTGLTEGSPDTAQLIYILYLSSLLLGVTAFIGLIWAYLSKKDAPDWLQTHYVFLIHTFWKGVLYGVVGVVLSVVLIGFLVLLFAAAWWVIRCIKGLQALSRKEPIKDPRRWLF